MLTNGLTNNPCKRDEASASTPGSMNLDRPPTYDPRYDRSTPTDWPGIQAAFSPNPRWTWIDGLQWGLYHDFGLVNTSITLAGYVRWRPRSGENRARERGRLSFQIMSQARAHE